MARVTYVKKAQQRFETRPVIDPETGEQKQTPVMVKKKDYETGEIATVQKTTKTGRLVFLSITEPDKSRPKENLRCDFQGCTISGKEILPGHAYKHISPKSGPYGGRQLSRHAEHPSWNVWEYSSSLSARLAEITHNFWTTFDSATIESEDDVTSMLEDTASEIESLAEEKRESASNIEEGFGHPTSASEDLEQVADDLEAWAEDVRSADIPEVPEPEEGNCEECGGTGRVESTSVQSGETDCEGCEGSGLATPDEPTDDQMDEWRESCRDACSVVDEAP